MPSTTLEPISPLDSGKTSSGTPDRETRQRVIDRLRQEWRLNRRYEPGFLAFAHALVDLGEYEEAESVALALHRRAVRELGAENTPPEPAELLARCYRSWAFERWRAGDFQQAIRIYEKLALTDRLSPLEIDALARLVAR